MGRILLTVLAAFLVAASVLAQDEIPGQVLVSRQLAESAGLERGQIIRLSSDAQGTGAQSFRIAGIYEPVPDPARLGRAQLEVRLHLPDLLALTRGPDVTEGTEHVEGLNIALVDPADAARFAGDVNARTPGVLAQPASESAESAAPFRVIE